MFLITAHLDFRILSLFGFCSNALLNTSTQQPTDLPEPTGPRIPRKKLLSFMKSLRVLPSGL